MDKRTRKMLLTFIENICEILEISMPEVSFDESRFQTATTLAQCDSRGDTIYLKDMNSPSPDLLFSAAHELRHIWQMRTDRVRFFDGYRTADRCRDIDEYNLQPAEVDANAFAGIVMVDFFGMKPQFHGLSEGTKAKIQERTKEIIEEMQ